MRRNSGFTLVELLVVIGILSVLFVVLLQALGGGQAAADQFACTARLKQLFTAIEAYRSTHKREVPSGGGTEFLYNLWTSLERTTNNRDLFFCPEIEGADEVVKDLKRLPLDDVWKTRQDFDSTSTHYAARAKAHKRTMLGGRQAWIADDNEFGMNHRTGATNVLWGDGNVTSYQREDLQKDSIWPADDPAFVLKVGAGSPIKELETLDIK
jgi:prepilin-type N-terminal cleavage/methylation domain-containing protein/prepilin-type processing-associated H-X9-DG protein